MVAFSGLDGAGKSTQVTHLRDALERLGFDAVAEWPAIDAPSPWLRTVARVGKAVLAAPRSRRSEAVSPQEPQPLPADPGARIRQRSRVLTFGWSMLVALRGAYRIAATTWPHVLLGRVVVCDRYLLDSCIYLLHQYGERRSYPLQLGLLRLIAPRPRVAYLLDIPPRDCDRAPA